MAPCYPPRWGLGTHRAPTANPPDDPNIVAVVYDANRGGWAGLLPHLKTAAEQEG